MDWNGVITKLPLPQKVATTAREVGLSFWLGRK